MVNPFREQLHYSMRLLSVCQKRSILAPSSLASLFGRGVAANAVTERVLSSQADIKDFAQFSRIWYFYDRLSAASLQHETALFC